MSDEVDVAALSDAEARAIARRRRREGWLGYLGTVLPTLGAVGLAFGTSVPLLFWLGVALVAAGILHAVLRGPRYAQIIQEHRQFQERAEARSKSLTTVLDSAMRALMEDLPVDFSQSRISVYRHKDNNFILLDRVSRSQLLERAGRDSYPDDQGVIGRTWDQGWAVVTRLPQDRATWNARCVRDSGMSLETARQLSMQSRSFVGKRIDLAGPVERPVGLILLESLAPQGVNGSTYDALASSANYKSLSFILQEVVQCLDEQDVAHFRRVRRT